MGNFRYGNFCKFSAITRAPADYAREILWKLLPLIGYYKLDNFRIEEALILAIVLFWILFCNKNSITTKI